MPPCAQLDSELKAELGAPVALIRLVSQATLPGGFDHFSGAVDAHQFRAHGRDLFGEYAVATAQIQNPFPWLRIQQGQHRLAEGGHEMRVLGIAGGIPGLRCVHRLI